MKTFLINYTLRTYEYMNDSKTEPKVIMVEAETSKLAEETLIAYLDSISDQYSTSYSAYDIEVIETIKQIDFIK